MKESSSRNKTVNEAFRKFADKFSNIAGSPWSFLSAIIIVVIWASTGSIFKYSDTWQLVINTGTTIVTFLMVFIIQNTQNRDNRAIHLKLDELIRSMSDARNSLMDLEHLSDEELDRIEEQFKKIRDNHEKIEDTIDVIAEKAEKIKS